MIEYSRSHIKKVNSAFVIEPFHQKKASSRQEKNRLVETFDFGGYLVIPLLLFLGIGIVLDGKWGTKPVFTIIGLLIGITGSFFNLIKIVQRFSKHA